MDSRRGHHHGDNEAGGGAGTRRTRQDTRGGYTQQERPRTPESRPDGAVGGAREETEGTGARSAGHRKKRAEKGRWLRKRNKESDEKGQEKQQKKRESFPKKRTDRDSNSARF